MPIEASAKCKGTRSGVSITSVSSERITADIISYGNGAMGPHFLVRQKLDLHLLVVVFVVINLLTDITYGILDPRIRLSAGRAR